MKTITNFSIIASAFLALSSTSAFAGANLIQNGSFENFTVLKEKAKWKNVTFDAWNGEGRIATNLLGQSATNGASKLILDGSNEIDTLSQAINTIDGETYQLVLDAYAGKKNLNSGTIEILIDEEVIATFNLTQTWAEYSATFQGTGLEQILTIQEVDSQNNRKGAFVDNVRVTTKDSVVAGSKVNLETQEEYKQKLDFTHKGKYVLENAPKGMAIYPNGTLVWTPTNNQEGDYGVSINVLSDGSIVDSKDLDFHVANVTNTEYDGVFIDLSSKSGGDGTPENPYGTYKEACTNLHKKHNIYLRGGVYKNPGYRSDYSQDGRYSAVEAECKGTQKNPIVIRPWGSEYVKIKTDALYGIKVKAGAKYITIQDLEIEGEAQKINLDTALAHWWWDSNDTMQSSGIVANGDDIVIKDTIVHDMPGSGISVSAGAYAEIEGNVVYNCDWWTIAGSKGIGITSATGSGAKNKYKNKIVGNLIFNIEQRLFSHVWKKKFATLSIDEGEAFLIQEGKQQNGTSTSSYNGKYLVKDNLILFNGKAGVVNLAKDINITNNSYYNNGGTTKQSAFRISNTNHMNVTNNAIESNIADTIIYSRDRDSNDIELAHNYAKGEMTKDGSTVTGIASREQIFNDPDNFDFSIVSSLPQDIGVSSTVLQDLKKKVDLYAIKVQKRHMEIDEVAQTKYIVEHAPGDVSCKNYNDEKNPYVMISNIDSSHTLVTDSHTSEFKLMIAYPYGNCVEHSTKKTSKKKKASKKKNK